MMVSHALSTLAITFNWSTALMSGFHPVSVFTCLTVRKEGGSRGKSFHSTWAVPESFGIARESMLPYVHVTM